MTKKRFVDMTDKEKKAYRVRNQLRYLKTEKGKASIARRVFKPIKKLSPVQIRILKDLKEGAYLRVWHQDVSPSGWHCELKSRNNILLRPFVQLHTVELLQSEEKQGMLLEIKSKSQDEIIYEISKKGLGVLEKELKNGLVGKK